MKILIFQHVEFETPGIIQTICKGKAYEMEIKKLYEIGVPAAMDFDLLILMGGPMSISDEDKYPFLIDEKKYIKNALINQKKVLGICLGSQLLADALGAKVFPGESPEIGWFPVVKTNLNPGFLPDIMTSFHWHGDTFELPHNALQLYKSDHTPNQAFLYNNQALGLQFHMEMDRKGLHALIENCRSELIPGRWVMTEQEILEKFDLYSRYNHKTMENILHYFLNIKSAPKTT